MMETVNHFFFLCIFVGAYFADDISSTFIKTKYDDDAPIITSRKALKKLMHTTTNMFHMCHAFGICNDIEFSDTLNKIEDNDGTEINTTKKELGDLCYTSFDCSNLMATCVDYKCQCMTDTIQWNNKCYHSRDRVCTDSSNCISTRLECRNMKCVLSQEIQKGDFLCHNKSGVSVCWGNEWSKGSPNILCRSRSDNFEISGVIVNKPDGSAVCRYFYNKVRDTDRFELLKPDDKIVWKNSNFSLNNAIFGGQDSTSYYHFYLICQTERDHIKYVGQLFKPYYNVCRFNMNGTIHESKIFDVLVYDA